MTVAYSTPRSHPPTALAFWLLIALICVFGTEKAIVTPLDPDLFWHLRVADQLTSQGIHPLVDHISFSSSPAPWTPYSWLAELGMRAIWNTTGFRGTIIAQILAIVGITVSIAASCLEITQGQKRLNCAMATVLGAYLTLPYTSFRPATFAIFWLAIITWLLLRDRRLAERSRAVWVIIPITILLANIHLAVVIVPIFVGSLWLGAIIERRGIARYSFMLIAVCFACLTTPMLPGVLRTIWHYQFDDVMVQSAVIGEMHPIYQGLFGIVTCAIVAILIAWALVFRTRVRIGEWLWLIAAAALALRLGRFSPMLAMILAPVLAAALPAMSDAVLTRKPIIIALCAALVLTTGKLAWKFPRPAESLDAFINRDDTMAYPANAARFVEQNVKPAHHRLINEFTWGGYLAWRLGDQYQVFLDGRTQLFPADFWKATYLGEEPAIEQALRTAHGDVAIIPAKKSRFKKALVALGWKTIYSDDRAEVLLPPA